MRIPFVGVGICLLTGLPGIAADHPELVGHTGDVTAVAFSTDGTKVVTGGADRTVRLWEAATGKELRTLNGHKNAIAKAMFSPDGKYVASQDGQDRTWNLWQADNGGKHGPFPGTHWGGAFTPESKHFVSTVDKGEGTTRLRWETATGQQTVPPRGVEVPLPSNAVKGTRTDVPGAFAYSPDGKRMAILGETRMQNPTMFEAYPYLAVRDRETCKVLRHREMPRVNSGDVQYSPDGKKVLATLKNPRGTVTRVLDAETLDDLGSVPAGNLGVLPDGKTMIGKGPDGRLGLYDLGTGKQVAPLPGTVAAASPKTPLLAVGSKEGGVKLIDLDDALKTR